jgi:hypothetical protein
VSVPVGIERLREEIARFGAEAFLLTVRDDNRPHVVSVAPRWDGDALVVRAGGTSIANAAARPSVTLLWPAGVAGAFSLIVDGTAAADADADAGDELAIDPVKAVLHRSAAGPDGSGPAGSECEPVLRAEG